MQITKKLFSLLLATILVVSLTLPTVVSADTLVNKGSADSFVGMASDAGNIHYLSDLHNASNPKALNNYVVAQLNNNITLDRGYHDYLMVFENGQRWEISTAKGDADGNRTLESGNTYNAKEIALGYNGTRFEKGMGVYPDATGKPDRYIVYNVSELDVNRFYAVVGGTGKNITHPTFKDYYLEFELLGSKSETYDPNSFESLAKAEKIRSYLTAEFIIDIADYNYIMLVVRSTGSSNSSCGGVWGGACVYTSAKSLEPAFGNAAQPDAYTLSEDGTYTGMPSEYKSHSEPLADIYTVLLDSSNTSDKASTLNTPYGTTNSKIVIGTQDKEFMTGIGMHPRTPAESDSYTTFNVSELNAARFYAVVGITNANGKDGKGSGVLFGVYGEYGDNKFVLLAQSSLIKSSATGELDVDITGVKTLKLVVRCGGLSNASSGCVWADASIYSTDGDLTIPEEPVVTPPTPETTQPTGAAPSDNDNSKSSNKMDFSFNFSFDLNGKVFPWGLVIVSGVAVLAVAAAVIVIIIVKKKKD